MQVLEAEGIILGELCNSWKCIIFEMAQRWKLLIGNDVEVIDFCINLIEQRRAVQRASVSQEALLRCFGDIKSKLMAKIDNEISEQCQLIANSFSQYDICLRNCAAAYDRSISTFHANQGQLGDFVPVICARTETRPSIEELFAWMDEIILHYQEEFIQKRKLFSEFAPESLDVMLEMRRQWKPKFYWEKREDCIILHVKQFIQQFVTKN